MEPHWPKGLRRRFELKLVPGGQLVEDDDDVAGLSDGSSLEVCASIADEAIHRLAEMGLPPRRVCSSHLLDAVNRGDCERIRLIVAGVPRVFTSDIFREAILKSDVPVLQALLSSDIVAEAATQVDEWSFRNTEKTILASEEVFDLLLRHGIRRFATVEFLVAAAGQAYDWALRPFLGDRRDLKRALLAASVQRHMPTCKLLLNHMRVNLNAKLRGVDNVAHADCLVQLGARASADALFRETRVDFLRVLLHGGASLELQRGSAGVTPLLDTKDVAKQQRLLELGANVAAQDSQGRTMMMLCPQMNTVQLALQHGADVNAADANGVTCLMHAAQQDERDVVRLLLQRGANPELGGNAAAQDSQGRTVMMMYPQLSTVQLCLQHGADVNAADADGVTCLMHAAQHGERDVVRLLLQRGADPNARSKAGRTALWAAADSGVPAVLSALLQGGACVNTRDEQGVLLSHHIVKHCDLPMFEAVAAVHPLDVHAQDSEGRTLLMHAVRVAASKAAVLLRRRDAKLFLRDNNGMTALLHAAAQCNTASCRILLQRRDVVMPPADSKCKMTCLMHAALCTEDPAPTIKLLVAFGAKLEEQDADGKTALWLALERHNLAAYDALVASGACINVYDRQGEPLSHAILATVDKPQVVSKLLVHATLDLNARDSTGKTLLMGAARLNRPAALTQLLGRDGGPHIDSEDSKGWTALSHAIASQAPITANAELLLRHGADVNAGAVPPLMVSVECAAERACALLLQHGADPAKPGPTGSTCRDVARQCKTRAAVLRLLCEDAEKSVPTSPEPLSSGNRKRARPDGSGGGGLSKKPRGRAA